MPRGTAVGGHGEGTVSAHPEERPRGTPTLPRPGHSGTQFLRVQSAMCPAFTKTTSLSSPTMWVPLQPGILDCFSKRHDLWFALWNPVSWRLLGSRVWSRFPRARVSESRHLPSVTPWAVQHLHLIYQGRHLLPASEPSGQHIGAGLGHPF